MAVNAHISTKVNRTPLRKFKDMQPYETELFSA